MTSYTLWIRLKPSAIIDECVEQLGEKFNGNKPYKCFPTHITLVPSISSQHPNMQEDEIIDIVKKSIQEVKEELGKGKSVVQNYFSLFDVLSDLTELFCHDL